MPERFHTLIIGGGVMGLGIAYRLMRAGVSNVLVLDKSYLTGGASGRNGGGVRQQWATEDNIELMTRSMRLFRDMTHELGINIFMRQGGYLFLLDDEKQVEAFTDSTRLQNAHGLPTRMVAPGEAAKIAPGLATDGILAAAYNPSDAVLFPWPVIWGYAEACRAMGVSLMQRTRVLDLETRGDRISAVVTDRGTFSADWVVNAAGAWSPEVAAMAGVSLPNQPVRHEILASEPIKPWLDPMVVHFSSGLYFSQSMRGELITGISVPSHQPGDLSATSSYAFLRRISRHLLRFMPHLGNLRILRQWAGPYDLTPDNRPILGPAGYGNFIQVHGFAGHGFMISPAIVQIVAEYIAHGTSHPFIERHALSRFEKGLAEKESFIIG